MGHEMTFRWNAHRQREVENVDSQKYATRSFHFCQLQESLRERYLSWVSWYLSLALTLEMSMVSSHSKLAIQVGFSLPSGRRTSIRSLGLWRVYQSWLKIL